MFLCFFLQPVYLRLDLNENSGIVKCCDHTPCICLPASCDCCKSYAFVTINVIDMSDYLTPATRNSYKNLNQIDNKLLHEPITKDMLLHEPYTPESVDSHSPQPEKDDITTNLRRNSVTPEQLKSRLESYIMHELIDNQISDFRGRTMSELPKNRLISTSNDEKKSISLQRLQSHHSSSDDDWFELTKDNNSIENKQKINCCILI